MPPLRRRSISGSESSTTHETPINPLARSQQDSAREIRRRPVPTSNSVPNSEQQGRLVSTSEQNSASHQTSVSTRASEVLDSAEASSKQNDAFESASSPRGVIGQIQTVEPISDDDSSTLNSSLEPPPAYGYHPQMVDINQEGFYANATTANDGRVDIKINSSARRISKLFTPSVHSQLEHANDSLPQFSPLSGDAIGVPTPQLNVVVQIVGSRGDVQPFVSLGLALKKFGHRVRIATHPTFQRFIEDLGLEFFSIGGDPAELMAFMVKNPGLIPKFATVRQGEVQKRRRAMRDILRGCWRSCIEAGNGLDVEVTRSSIEAGLLKDPKPFVADAIIANPPTFAHIHCAEKLGIPLHMMFTMPWSSTQAFPHPLANIKSSDENAGMTNYLSYMLVEVMNWQGLGDVINRFRRKVLGLEPIDPTWAPGMMSRLQIPYTYCWSPALIPKPEDWGKNITISGFYFLPLASSYMPPPELESFLQAGPPPIYIGFGSIVVDDPDALTQNIFEAIRIANVRAIVSQGWGDLGGSMRIIPPNVFMIGNCPHDWLFERVSCVVHHGGAGTTAAGIAAGKPTVVVPFFGDQHFWGSMMARSGAGPPPIPAEMLTASKLAAAIVFALKPAVLENASLLGQRIGEERGSDNGVQSFHDRLPLGIMGCSMSPHRAAVWKVPRTDIKLSVLAATVLRKEKLLDLRRVKLFRPCEYALNHGPWDPVTGGTLAVADLFYDVFKGIGEIGQEFVRVPNVGQNNGESSKSAQRVHYPARPPANTNTDIVGQSATRGVNRLTKATLRSPMTFAVGMAQGAHNMPKMWGDTTVRPQDKITGLGSGFKAAGKELALGTFDGFSGLFTQPIKGGLEEGGLGVAKGLGKGVMGAVLKPFAAASGVVGYSLKGIDMEITKGATRKIFDPVISAREAQGELEYIQASQEEKNEIIQRWLTKVAAKKSSRKEKKKLSKREAKGKGQERV